MVLVSVFPACGGVMRTYRFTSTMTISVLTEVDADTLEMAVREARDRRPVSLCHQCATGEHDTWNTSGELDGEPDIEGSLEISIDDDNMGADVVVRARALWAAP